MIIEDQVVDVELMIGKVREFVVGLGTRCRPALCSLKNHHSSPQLTPSSETTTTL